MGKECFKCKQVKPYDDFYRHAKMADGFLGKCKSCTKQDVNTRYQDPQSRTRIVAYEKTRFQRPERKQKALEYMRKYRKIHALKYKARGAVANAVKRGDLVKLPCQHCGSKKSEAHHPDYEKPLEVKWVCFKCHREKEHGQKTSK